MSEHISRKDKTCLNCFHVVEKNYCPNCGQENSETKQSFHHLFTHFIEDLVHYDGAFWKTVKDLLFKPAQLSQVYLSGRRKIYVPPVKLYIFINFLAFFLLSILPLGSGNNAINFKEPEKTGESGSTGYYHTVKELDAHEKALPESEKMNAIQYWFHHRLAEIDEHTTEEELGEKLMESFFHNMPKVLFLYMPVFALSLWLFHGKKRWYYFEHGIFTLHYFSFLLLTFSGLLLLIAFTTFLEENVAALIRFFMILFMMLWWFFYFFRSHSKFYGERKLISRLKGFGLFIINMTLIFVFLVGALLYSMLSIH